MDGAASQWVPGTAGVEVEAEERLTIEIGGKMRGARCVLYSRAPPGRVEIEPFFSYPMFTPNPASRHGSESTAGS
jgi:hypothetical protein